jgi:dihydroflavonol-4-reductase
MGPQRVLVTGGSGFLGVHCVAALLRDGHQVRVTVRNPAREKDVRTMLAVAGAEAADLTFVAADLLEDRGWGDAVEGCDRVLHVASPFPFGSPRNDDELILPAREGTRRVLRAARAHGVRRVVVTSSFAAVGYGQRPRTQPFTEDDWTDTAIERRPYVRSKTLAELAAWRMVDDLGGPELAVVNPVVIFGPVLGPDFSSSIQLVRMLMSGRLPAVPRLSFGVVDVRDVADLHVLAMTHPQANGSRILATAGPSLTMPEMALLLRRRLGPVGARIPTRTMPDALLRAAALVLPPVRQVAPELGVTRHASNAKALDLGWRPRSAEDALVSTAQSLLSFGLVR